MKFALTLLAICPAFTFAKLGSNADQFRTLRERDLVVSDPYFDCSACKDVGDGKLAIDCVIYDKASPTVPQGNTLCECPDCLDTTATSFRCGLDSSDVTLSPGIFAASLEDGVVATCKTDGTTTECVRDCDTTKTSSPTRFHTGRPTIVSAMDILLLSYSYAY